MERLRLALSLCAVAAFLVACGRDADTPQPARVAVTPSPASALQPAAPPSTADEFADARATYNATCVRCHQQSGEGGTVEFDAGTTVKVPSFKRASALTRTDADFVHKITNGDDAMPAFGKRLTQEQIAGLVRFIRHEFQAGLQPGGQKPGAE
ncbi:MAG TPA: cytochrome c [Pyrinomonadaceae bacterium]|nr:cytochrome c [Pyrinomonadaceae bacterium]